MTNQIAASTASAVFILIRSRCMQAGVVDILRHGLHTGQTVL